MPDVSRALPPAADAPGGAEDRAQLDLMIRGFQLSRMIKVAADLALADRIEPEGRHTVASLAEACGVVPGPLHRILRALASFGLFRISAEGVVEHSPRSLLLRSDTPNSLHYAARFWTIPGTWRAWGALDAALTGGIPHHAAWGQSRFDYLREHQDEARIFDSFMAHYPNDRLRAFAAAYDFSRAGLIVDVGGGNGEVLRVILTLHPEPRGLVFDVAHVIAAIPLAMRLGGRIDIEAGSFFERVPEGGDLYLLNWILHDWSDEDCRRILSTCRKAMGPDARLLIGEWLLEPDPANGQPTEYLLDIQMMASFGEARERTESEFRDLLAASGFAVRRVIPTGCPQSLIEAVPR